MASIAAATGALVLPFSAFAHVTVAPARVEPGERTLVFTVPNEFGGARGRSRIDEVVIEAPAGVRLGNAEAKAGWTIVVHGQTATWRGGAIGYRRYGTFGVDVEVSSAASDLVFRATERFGVPRHVERYPVPISLGSPPSSNSDHELALAALLVALAAAGLAAASLFVGLARWLRGA